MDRLCRRWDTSRCAFGDLVVLAFIAAQALDGAFTYLGITLWGPQAEGNPLIRSAVAFAGTEAGIAGAKLFAVALGMALHLWRVHTALAFLTALYVAGALVPWTALFLLS